MLKERRCNLFDDRGRPRRMKDGTLGCFRDASACHFVHPHERDWKTAHPSLPPKHELVVDSDSDFHYSLVHTDRFKDPREEKERERDRDRMKERERRREGEKKLSLPLRPESPHRRDSMTTRASSPGLPSRKSTFDSTMDYSGTTKRGRSPASSTSLEQLRHRTHDFAASTSSHRSNSRSRDKGKDKERTNLPSKAHVSDTRSQRLSTLPPEPPKPPLPQIPEVPKVPSFASNQPSTSSAGTMSKGSKGLSLDEQRSAWHERIDFMFSSITLRRDYTKLESDLSQIRMVSNSSLVNSISETDRHLINAQKVALESQMEAKRKEINENIQKLVKTEFWPILRTPQISEVEKTLGETKKHVLEVKGLLDDVKNSCAALFKTNAADRTQDLDRPFKRRKLEEEGDTPGRPTGGNAQAMSEDTTKELEALRDKLTELDGHLVKLENDIIQRDQIVSDEIELRIDARLEEEDTLYPPVNEGIDVSRNEIEAVVDAKNKELVHAVVVTGEEIGALAVEVAELISKVNTLEARCRVLEAENQEFKNRLSKVSQDHANSQDALVRRDKEIEAIAAALQAYISQTPASQKATDLPSPEYIIESLNSQLEGLFREKFCAALVDVQREVLRQVQESHNRTLDIVSPHVMLLLKMVNLISARVGKPDMDAASTP